MEKRRTVKRIELKKLAVVFGCLFTITINSGVGNAQEISNDYSSYLNNFVYYSLYTNDNATLESKTVNSDHPFSEGVSAIAESIEEEMALEDWMLDTGNEFWKEIRMKLNEEEVEEEEVELEEWMLDLSYWQ